MLYLFEAIRNPRWLSWPLIDVIDFFSRTIACEVIRLARNAPLEVIKKYCGFSERFKIQQKATTVCDWLRHFYAPATKSRGGILIYPCPSVRPSGYRYMVCPANSSYKFRATALIFCRMFIHIMEVCMSTGF